MITGLTGRALALLAPMFVMRSMLDYLGPVLFGIWLTAVSLASLGNFLDFGIGNAALTRLSEAYGRDDYSRGRLILGQAYVLLAGLAAGFIVVTIAGAGLVVRLQPGGLGTHGQAAVVAITLCAFFLSFPAGLLIKLLQGRQSYVHAHLLQLTGPLVALPVTLLAIRASLDPVVVVLLYTLATPLTQATWSAVYFITHPMQRPVFDKLDWKSLQALTGIGGSFFVVSLLTTCGMNMDNPILATIIGAEAVTNFGVPARLGSLLMVLVFTLSMPLWSLFSHALARGNRQWLLLTAIKVAVGGAVTVLVIGLLLVMLADPLILLWMGRAFPNQQLVLLGMVTLATVIALTSPFNMILNAAGMARPQILPWIGFVSSCSVAKMLLVSPETIWWIPWITASAYVIFVTPRILQLVWRAIPEAFY